MSEVMDGYVQNVTSLWLHAFKKEIRPGSKVPLDDLYEQYGEKHGISIGDEFVEWIRTVKLKNEMKLKVIYNGLKKDTENGENAEGVKSELDVNASNVIDVNKQESTKDAARSVAPITAKKMEVEDIVNLSVRKARDILPNITDVKLLRYALQEATPRAGKSVLCQIIRKRISELGRLRTA